MKQERIYEESQKFSCGRKGKKVMGKRKVVLFILVENEGSFWGNPIISSLHEWSQPSGKVTLRRIDFVQVQTYMHTIRSFLVCTWLFCIFYQQQATDQAQALLFTSPPNTSSFAKDYLLKHCNIRGDIVFIHLFMYWESGIG